VKREGEISVQPYVRCTAGGEGRNGVPVWLVT
jgi:hypothetical protein